MGGIIPTVLGLLSGVIHGDEKGELLFLAISGAACALVIPFIFNLLFVTPEKLYKEIEKQLEIAKNQLSEKQIPIQSILDNASKRQIRGVTIMGAICIGLTFIFIVQNEKYSELKAGLNSVNSQPKQIAANIKPLPTQTIPRPEPPPVAPSKPAENQQAAVAQTNKPFENFGPDSINPDFSQVLSNKWATQVKAAAEVKKKRDKAENDLWSTDVPHFRHALICLRDSMLHIAEKDGDGISQSDGFLQCLPDNLDPDFGAFKPAEIRFQKNTNIDFMISVEAVNGDGNRGFIISCAAGFLQMGEGGGRWHCTVGVPSASFKETVVTDADGADTNTTSSIKELISAERYFLLHGNTQ
jgi:hypothetical protein